MMKKTLPIVSDKPIVTYDLTSKEKTVAWICASYATLDDKDRQSVLDFMVNLAIKRRGNGEYKEANSLAAFSVYLVKEYGGKIQ